MRTNAVSCLVLGLIVSSFTATWAQDEPTLASIEVQPAAFSLDGRWSSQSLVITGRLSDGTVRDLTAEAQLAPADANIAQVGNKGTITPVADGVTTISIVAKLGDASAQAAAQVTVKNSADDSAYFLRDVMPLIGELGCNATSCHGSTQGKGGLRLSMFGAEPKLDHEALTRSAEGRRLNRVEPLKSLLLLKATAAIEHAGGQKVQPGSPQYQMLALWIARGAPLVGTQSPELVSIEVLPQKQVFKKGETQRLLTTAVFSDGTRKDATSRAVFEAADAAVATVDEAGQVKAVDYGQASVIVSYMRKFAVVPILIPRPLSVPFPEVAANNKIDELVFAHLKELGIPPSELCTDQAFLRRVYLDVTGTLPTADQARAFQADVDPQKRSKLIDQLLGSKEFADYWALKWGDLFRMKSEYPSNLWPNAVQAFHRWVRDSIVKNKPYDQFARELITSSGSNFRSPPANYYRAFLKRDPQNLSEVTALVFMGARVGCARCHAHPSEDWSLDDNVSLAAFFAPVAYKATREWKEEIVYVYPRRKMYHPRTTALVPPKVLGGEAIELTPDEDPRVRLTQWLTAPENPWFARNIVNRVWFWLLGRGIIHEPDDLRSTNLPENPALLEFLERELVAHKYDLKHVYRLILNSKTYQLSSKANEFNRDDVAHFSHYQTKRLGAETLLDAISQVTETWDVYRSYIPEPFVVMPTEYRATHLADGSTDLPFLQLFGRPPRDTAYESDRDLRLSMRQTLHLLNSSDVQNKINASKRIWRLILEVKEQPKIIDELYLATLSRLPTDAERAGISDYMQGKGKTVAPEIQAAKTAADAALAKVQADLGNANTQLAAAEKVAAEGEAAAAGAKTATAQAATAETNTQNAAVAKRQQADVAKKKLDDLITGGQKPAEAQAVALAKALTDATAAKAVLDQPLAEAQAAAATAGSAFDAAEKAAADAEAQAKAVGEDAGKSAEEKKQAADDAAAKRQAADAAKAVLPQAQQNLQVAQTQVATAAGKLAETETQKKAADEALVNATTQVTAATGVYQAAEKVAQEAATAAAGAKAAAEAARTAQAAAEKAAVDKRTQANQTKAVRDKLTTDQQAATAKVNEANGKLATATAALKPHPHHATLDLLWALFNTKEFVFNH